MTYLDSPKKLSDAALAEFEALHGPLPEDYRAFIVERNGGEFVGCAVVKVCTQEGEEWWGVETMESLETGVLYMDEYPAGCLAIAGGWLREYLSDGAQRRVEREDLPTGP